MSIANEENHIPLLQEFANKQINFRLPHWHSDLQYVMLLKLGVTHNPPNCKNSQPKSLKLFLFVASLTKSKTGPIKSE